ncbi:sulfatase family protein [Aporhodopirellula aestuarii]|uniref:Sulfatase n=1 Tax=Aporhodopirellula aestuarii TaxID=2950107 RepID=A0ABT0TYW2_9BACT|nr:sulfatase [Aporhodopirellula aestuarii]MCM2369797.1 sulfatase [Aporhodopirellula aestuarii]
MRMLFVILLACVLAHVQNARVSHGQTHSRPNVIFFLTDDLGFSDISCYGATKVKTPNIDALANKGIKFTDFHTGASICSPSRAAFLTGAYPQRCGLYMGINENREEHWFLGLHPDEITLAEQFKNQDYQTFMIGKWHLGNEPEFHPLLQGFDHYYGMPSNVGHSAEFFDGEELIYTSTPLAKLTTLYTERATKIIKEHGGQPFFLYFAHNYPHTPYQAGKDFVGSSMDGVRGDVIQELDWGVGEMMKALEDAGIADNTIVIFTSDNGPLKQQYAQPYRGTKYVSLEGGHRVPFIFHWPAAIDQGVESETPVVAMDLFPTLSEIIGEPLPADREFDGVSLMPLLDGKALTRPETQPFFYYNCENLQAVRYGDWKLHLPRTGQQIPWWDKNKALVNVKSPVLYNLRNDLHESKDVASENPEIVQQMVRMADNTRKELGEYMQRGSGQRPTGSAVSGAPIISNGKDWQTVDAETRATIKEEHLKRHPESKKPSQGANRKRKRSQ